MAVMMIAIKPVKASVGQGIGYSSWQLPLRLLSEEDSDTEAEPTLTPMPKPAHKVVEEVDLEALEVVDLEVDTMAVVDLVVDTMAVVDLEALEVVDLEVDTMAVVDLEVDTMAVVDLEALEVVDLAIPVVPP
ncbi:hypothetical protein ACLKA6_013784 [Drosophila palustris]